MDKLASRFLQNGQAEIARHGDKGAWKISFDELKAQLSEVVANRVMAVLQHEFPHLVEKGETPLKLDGIKRSLLLGENLFERLPDKCILIVIDSGIDRAKLTRHLAVDRIAQLESQYNKGVAKSEQKRIDILEIEEADLLELIAYGDTKSWAPYKAKIESKELTSAQAVLQWLVDMNKAETSEEFRLPVVEGAKKYRKLIEQIFQRITGGQDRQNNGEPVPIVLFAVGHNESLGQIMYEREREKMQPEQIATFCEHYRFDQEGNLIDTQKVSL